MNDAILGSLSERHLLLFGTIIQLFARYELLMQEVIAKVSGADPAAIAVLTCNLDFSAKRQALLDLLFHWTIPVDQYDRIGAYLMVPHNLSRLRNDIVHAAWMSDPSSSAIQPDWILRPPDAVKPAREGHDAPGENYIKQTDDKAAYTLEGLEEIVESLAANYEELSGYLREIELIRGGHARPSAAVSDSSMRRRA